MANIYVDTVNSVSIDRLSLSGDIVLLSALLFDEFLGLVLNLEPQHGQNKLLQLINSIHVWHLFCPDIYLPIIRSGGFVAFSRSHIP